MHRSANCLAKLERVKRALAHQEPDQVPVSDFFWSSFLARWREEMGLAADADIYRYYDLDWRQMNPNHDPHIRAFEVLREDEHEVTIRTGFDAVLRKKFDHPMPAFLDFETNSLEKMRDFRFDDPADERRFFHAGDDQLNGAGDRYGRATPAFVERVRAVWEDFPVFGGVCEANEMLTRILGPVNAMLWIGLHPQELARFAERVFEFSLALLRAQIRACDGMLDGIMLWGDVAYKKGMMFSPAYWRAHFKPGVEALVAECHAHNLPVI